MIDATTPQEGMERAASESEVTGAGARDRPFIKFEPTELRELSRVSTLTGLLDVLLVWGGIFGAIAIAHYVDRWWAYLLCIVFIGGRQNALANMAHEAWHCLVFPNRAVNHAVAAWLFCYPIGIPYDHDRRRHLRHHRELGLPEDPDRINYANKGRETPARIFLYLLSLLCGRMLVATAWSILFRGKFRTDRGAGAKKEGPSALTELLRAVLVTFVLYSIMWALFEWWTYPLLWFLPLSTFTGFFANTRAFAEHASVDDDAPAAQRLRDLRVGPLEAILVSPCHFNYHALHHTFPSIPHHTLPAARRRLIEINGVYPFVERRGYVRTIIAHCRHLSALKP